MSRRFSLPVLPLRDTVVYPGVAVPISAGRPGTVEAVQEALDGDRRLFAVAQNQNQDDPDPEILYAVGTMVRIIQTHRVRGGIQLLVQGEARARAVAYVDDGEAMLRATVVPLERENLADPEDPAVKALDAELRERAAELATRRGATAENLNQLIQGVDDPGGDEEGKENTSGRHGIASFCPVRVTFRGKPGGRKAIRTPESGTAPAPAKMADATHSDLPK